MTTYTNSYGSNSYNLTNSHIGKPDRHTAKINGKYRTMFREATGKALPYAYTNGDKVDSKTMLDINRIIYNNGTRKEELNKTLNPRSAVLHRIQKYGIVLVEDYPISPRKKPGIKPKGEA